MYSTRSDDPVIRHQPSRRRNTSSVSSVHSAWPWLRRPRRARRGPVDRLRREVLPDAGVRRPERRAASRLRRSSRNQRSSGTPNPRLARLHDLGGQQVGDRGLEHALERQPARLETRAAGGPRRRAAPCRGTASAPRGRAPCSSGRPSRAGRRADTCARLRSSSRSSVRAPVGAPPDRAVVARCPSRRGCRRAAPPRSSSGT